MNKSAFRIRWRERDAETSGKEKGEKRVRMNEHVAAIRAQREASFYKVYDLPMFRARAVRSPLHYPLHFYYRASLVSALVALNQSCFVKFSS